MVNSMERALILAKDPVAASDFFNFSINTILNIYLVGTSLKKKGNLMVEFLDF